MLYKRISLSLLVLSSLSFLFFGFANSFATNTVISQVAVSIPVSCNISSELDEIHSATINNNTYQAGIGTTTFTVFCNDNSGFSIYAVGYSNEEFGNYKLIATVGGILTPSHDINTGTATQGNTSNWAMKLNAVTTESAGSTQPYSPTMPDGTNNTEDFTNYHAVPATYTKVATFNSNTDVTIGSSLQSTYAVYIAPTQPSGTYTGKVKYTLVHPASGTPPQPQTTTAGYIGYYPNTNIYEGTMSNQSATASTDTDLYAPNFSKTGYGFIGWSDKYDWEPNQNDADGNGTGVNAGYHIYGPNATITTPSDLASTGLSLYAIWMESVGFLQGFTCPNNTNMPIGTVTALTDLRDNQTYAVAKLKDGKCWMIENLRLNNQYTIGETYQAQAQGYATNFTGLAGAESPWANEITTANSLYSTDGSTVNTISGNNLAYRFPRYNNQNVTARVSGNNYVPDSNTYAYGNYYTWSATIADTGNYTQHNQNITTTSICPIGWHLPMGGSKANEANNEYWDLIVNGIVGENPANYASSSVPSYTGSTEGSNASIKVRTYPNNFMYSGRTSAESVNNRGDRGLYWSATVSGSDGHGAGNMGMASTAVSPGTSRYDRYTGLSVRCVADS